MAIDLGQTGILYPERMAQLKDFSNMKLNGFTPTDIDFAYDVRGDTFVFGELKCSGAPFPMGQRRLLMALLFLCIEAKKNGLLLVAEHDTQPSEPIDVGNLYVTQSDHTHNGAIVSNTYVGMTVHKASSEFLDDNAQK
jgi:hypothetical protein